MFKFRTLCLFLFIAFSSSVVNARVCFLPGVFASDGCMSGDAMISCQTHYTQTTPCEEGQVQRTCVENGVTYYKCDCPETNIIFTDYKYQCIGNYDPVCGCPSNQTKCSDIYYPFKGCSDFENSYGSEDFCDSPSDGERYYSYCECSRNDYPYTCADKGLKVSSTAGKCTDSHGKTYYEYCDCADNWSTGDCAENSDGCTVLVDGPVDRGGSLNCYRCGSEACSDPSQLNLEAYFCLNPDVATTVVQCENLGYVYSTDGICPDGTAGLKCIFDSNYIFCETKTAVECKYASEADCLAPEGNETCVVNYDGCNVVTKCKQGYKLSADRSQCEEIVCDINEREYLNQSTCLASMKNVKCKKDSKGCYVVDGCVNGYLLSADGTTCEADCSLQETYMTCDNGKGLYGSGDECVNTAIPSTSYHEACVVGEDCYNVNSSDTPYRANGGYCELVLSVEQANRYLRSGYYQVGDPCQPVNANLGKKIRLHSCQSTSRDCKGGYSPVYNYKTECLNSNDAGLTKTCGGQKYTDCICNDRQDYGGCYVREITKDTKVGLMKDNDYYIYTGEVKNGCEGYKKQYGYFRSITGLKKCKKSSENIDEAVAVCTSGSNKCPEGSEIQSANYSGTVYTRCKVPCVSIMSCEQYAQNNGISTTSNCKFSSSIPSGYTKLGEETISDENGSRKCYYLANCKSDLDGVCATLNANFEKIPSNYENCGYNSYNVPSNLDYKICNLSVYAEKCCKSKSNCSVSNDYEQFKGYISTGRYYEVNPDNVTEGCFYYNSCSSTSTDCSGKVSPINNAKTQAQCAAAGGFGVNPIAECGGKYFEACSSECKYKNTEESCSKLGMNFRAKCVGNDFKYGECY